MKKLTLCVIAGLFFVLAAGSIHLWAAGAPKGTSITMTGEAVDLFCYVSRGLAGVDQIEGCKDRTEKRNLPVGIVNSETGEIYLAVFRYKRPANNWPTSANEKLIPFLGAKVYVQGTTWEKNGMNVIEINMVTEAMD